jgi:hypothetical protein
MPKENKQCNKTESTKSAVTVDKYIDELRDELRALEQQNVLLERKIVAAIEMLAEQCDADEDAAEGA